MKTNRKLWFINKVAQHSPEKSGQFDVRVNRRGAKKLLASDNKIRVMRIVQAKVLSIWEENIQSLHR